MNILTKVVTTLISENKINEEIKKQENEGWYLRGTPIPMGSREVMLTFEKEELEEDIFNDILEDIPKDTDGN